MNLLDIVPASDGSGFDWPALCAAFDWIAALQGVPQDHVHHGEGDVATHLRMVCEALLGRLGEIADLEKARNVLFSQWGFDQKRYGQGIGALYWGPPGTGKSLAAEAVAYETGKPMMVVNAAELVSRYVGDTGKNIETLFQTARTNGAVLVFEEAEGLFGTRTDVADATDRYANLDIGLLLYHLERFPGIVILTTNKQDTIDEAFFRRLQFNLEFPLPDASLREELWRRLIPEGMPLAPEVDLAALASLHELSGGNIRNAVFKAAARAALRRGQAGTVTMADLMGAAAEEVKARSGRRIGFTAGD